MVAFVFEGLFVVFEHFLVLVRCDAVQTLLVVLIELHGAVVADVLEGSVQSGL
jgi:hypothetical protein